MAKDLYYYRLVNNWPSAVAQFCYKCELFKYISKYKYERDGSISKHFSQNIGEMLACMLQSFGEPWNAFKIYLYLKQSGEAILLFNLFFHFDFLVSALEVWRTRLKVASAPSHFKRNYLKLPIPR